MSDTDDPEVRVRAWCEYEIRWSHDSFRMHLGREVRTVLDAKDAEIATLTAEAVDANNAYNAAEASLAAQDAEIERLQGICEDQARWLNDFPTLTPADIGMIPVTQDADYDMVDGEGPMVVWPTEHRSVKAQLWREATP